MLLVVWYFLLCSFSPSLYLALSLFRLFDFGFSAYLCIVVQLLFTRLFLSSNSYRLSGRGFSGVHVSVILKCWKSENCFWRRPNTLRTIWSGTSFTKHQTQCIYAMRIFGLRRFAKNCNDRPATASQSVRQPTEEMHLLVQSQWNVITFHGYGPRVDKFTFISAIHALAWVHCMVLDREWVNPSLCMVSMWIIRFI